MDRSILKKQEATLYKNDTRRNVFQWPGVYQLLIAACIAADGITLFSLIDMFLKQSVTMSRVITIAVAGVLNIAAVLLASCLHNEDFTLRTKITLAGLILGVFLLFFGATFTLRVASMEQMYGSNSNSLDITIQNSTGEQNAYVAEEQEFKPTVGQIILAVILGLEPLGTSILCFYIGYEQSPKRKRYYLLTKQKKDIEEAIDHDKVMLEELKADLKFDLDAYDKEQFDNFVAIVVQLGEHAKDVAHRKLTEHDGTPEGVSYIMEGGYLNQNNKGNESDDSAHFSAETNAGTNKRIKSIA